jgi:hypothetical protein
MRHALIVLAAMTLPMAAHAANCSDPNSVTKVTNRRAAGFEYVDFFVKAPFTGTVSVTAAASGTFTEDPSGDSITVAGNKWTEVKFRGMFWMCNVVNSFSVPKPIIKGVKSTGQLEGHVDYAIGRKNGHYLGVTTTTIGGQKRVTLKFGP